MLHLIPRALFCALNRTPASAEIFDNLRARGVLPDTLQSQIRRNFAAWGQKGSLSRRVFKNEPKINPKGIIGWIYQAINAAKQNGSIGPIMVTARRELEQYKLESRPYRNLFHR
jgi:hypothetical protein